MRIHVVTPKAPVHVTLNPRVQPGPSPCPIFVTGCEEPIKLSQSAYWVLRLPYPFQNVYRIEMLKIDYNLKNSFIKKLEFASFDI